MGTAARDLLQRVRGSVRPRRAIPISDAAALGGAIRRTTIVRLVVGAALLLLGALVIWRATVVQPRPVSFVNPRTTTIVVLDQSNSVYITAYKRIAQMLRALVRTNAPTGLVAFSDTAYEMMPPGMRGSNLRPLLRFYTRRPGSNVDPNTLFAANPWQDVFSGGTKISAGIDLARSIAHRDHIQHATIVLVSDLETAGEDEPKLADSLVAAKHDRTVAVKVVPLFPNSQDLGFFQRFLPRSAFIQPSQLHLRALRQERPLLVSSPWPIAIVAALLLLVLAVNELWCARVLIPRAKPALS
jgi:hypothetical protein